MKHISLLLACMLGLLLAIGCSDDVSLAGGEALQVSMKAVVDSVDRALLATGDDSTWTASLDGDIAVYNAVSNHFERWQNGSDAADTLTFSSINAAPAAAWTGYAVYPAEVGAGYTDSRLVVDLPAHYDAAPQPVMVAPYGSEGCTLSFQHIVGMLHVMVTHVPTSATELILRAPGRKINGEFEVDELSTGEHVITTQSVADESAVSVTLNGLTTADGCLDLYFPLPVGDYPAFELALMAGNDNLFTATTANDVAAPREGYTMGRCLSQQVPPQTFVAEGLALSIPAADSISVSNHSLTIHVPYDTDVTHLAATIAGNDRTPLYINATPQAADSTVVDASMPLLFTAGNTTLTTTIAWSQYPVVYISTPDGNDITNRDTWLAGAQLTLGNTGSDATDLAYATSIRGRGNSTWTRPKKPYAIKLNRSSEVLGMPAHKRWVLLANYYDYSDLRTALAFDMGAKSKLAYTPRVKYVEVVVNGNYRGLYQLTEQLRIDANRVNIGSKDLLLEVDYRAGETGETQFRVPHLSNPIVFTDPDDVTTGDATYTWAKDFITRFDSVLFSNDYLSLQKGYRQYINMESFVDWYLINEISKNNDACFFSSCYLTLTRDGVLSMGPLWDFDLAFGNTTDNGNDKPQGFWIKDQVAWFSRFFTDPTFVAMVKKRFDYFYSLMPYYEAFIDEQCAALAHAQYGNSRRWPRFTTSKDAADIQAAYAAQCNALKSFYVQRMAWLKSAFDNM